jgi:pyruvate dehydrogenase E1 component alpha subunit
MLGALVPVTVGAALAFKRRNEARVALTFFGDGTMSTGDVHEGLNLAAVLQVPAVFVLQNNGYAYSTPIERQMVNTNMAQRVREGWGIPSERVDGTDALAVYASVLGAIERARAGEGPQAVEALTLRMHGHAAHDDGRYMDRERLRTFADRFDPVERLAARLRLDGLRIDQIDTLRQAAVDEVSSGLAEAEAAPAPDPATLADGVYAMPPEGT